MAGVSGNSAIPTRSEKSESWPVSIEKSVSKITATGPLKAGRDCPAVDASSRAKGRQEIACASMRPAAGRAVTRKRMALIHAAAHGPGVTSLTPTGCRCPAAEQIQTVFHQIHSKFSFLPLRPAPGEDRHHQGSVKSQRDEGTHEICVHSSLSSCVEQSLRIA